MPVDIRKLANVVAGGQAVGATNMGGTTYGGAAQGPPMPSAGTVQAGAASIPGMSIHCLGCGAKLKKGVPQCPKCGNDVRRVAEDDPDANHGSDGTGAEAAVRDAQADGGYEDEGKYASARTLRVASDLGKNVVGGASVVAGLEAARRYTMPIRRQMDDEARRAEAEETAQRYKDANTGRGMLRKAIRKAASARPGNPIYNIRRGTPSNVEDGLRAAEERVSQLKDALARKGY